VVEGSGHHHHPAHLYSTALPPPPTKQSELLLAICYYHHLGLPLPNTASWCGGGGRWRSFMVRVLALTVVFSSFFYLHSSHD